MESKDRKRIRKMADNLRLPDDELRKMQISLQIDLGESYHEEPEKLREFSDQQSEQYEKELNTKLSELDSKSAAAREKALKALNPNQTSLSLPNPDEQTAAPAAPPPEPPKPVDTKAAVRVSDDKMHAFLSLVPPENGGRIPTVAALEKYLTKKGVTYGVNRKQLEEVLNDFSEKQKPVTDIEVATGKEMEAGEDAVLDIKFTQEGAEEFAGDIQDEGTISIGSVTKDQVLLIHKPATPGRPGYTVTGEEVKPPEVDEKRVEPKRNTRRSGDQILSTMTGIVYYYPDSILVKPYADARVDIKSSPDKMEARATFFPEIGEGLKLSKKVAMKALDVRRIKYGILEDEIEKAIEEANTTKAPVKDILVAKGTPAEDGADGKVIFKVKMEATMEFREQQGGRIDFREKDLIVNIPENTLLAVQFPPNPKVKDGTNIKGETIPSTDGAAAELEPGKNVEVREKEEGIKEFYSKIGGQIKFESPKISIEPLYVVEGNLDLKVGNIDFLGNVLIKGSIDDGFTVKAGGDIEVKGNVGSSDLESDRNIRVHGGVVSRSHGTIRAKGTITVRFAENAKLIAQEDIVVFRAVLHSEIAAGRDIICTKEKGQIIGGHTVARNRIQVKELGTGSGTKTEVTIGMDYFEIEQMNKLSEEQSKFSQAMEKIGFIIAKFDSLKNPETGEVPPDMREEYVDIMQKKVLVEKKLHEIKMKKVNLSLEEKDYSKSEVVIEKDLHPDVRINLGKEYMDIQEHRVGQRIFPTEAGKLSIEPWRRQKAEK